jgi:hypothetical protein
MPNTPERMSAVAIAIAIFIGAGLTAFNVGRYDALHSVSCKTLRPLVMPFKGTMP